MLIIPSRKEAVRRGKGGVMGCRKWSITFTLVVSVHTVPHFFRQRNPAVKVMAVNITLALVTLLRSLL